MFLFDIAAQSFSDQYFGTETHGASHPALNVLNRLCKATDRLSNNVSALFVALEIRNVRICVWTEMDSLGQLVEREDCCSNPENCLLQPEPDFSV